MTSPDRESLFTSRVKGLEAMRILNVSEEKFCDIDLQWTQCFTGPYFVNTFANVHLRGNKSKLGLEEAWVMKLVNATEPTSNVAQQRYDVITGIGTGASRTRDQQSTWRRNTYTCKSVEILSNFQNVKSPCANVKPSYWSLSGNGSGLNFTSFCATVSLRSILSSLKK